MFVFLLTATYFQAPWLLGALGLFFQKRKRKITMLYRTLFFCFLFFYPTGREVDVRRWKASERKGKRWWMAGAWGERGEDCDDSADAAFWVTDKSRRKVEEEVRRDGEALLSLERRNCWLNVCCWAPLLSLSPALCCLHIPFVHPLPQSSRQEPGSTGGTARHRKLTYSSARTDRLNPQAISLSLSSLLQEPHW